jgi:L-asparaginase II
MNKIIKFDGSHLECNDFFAAARRVLAKLAEPGNAVHLISSASGSRANLMTYCAHSGYVIKQQLQCEQQLWHYLICKV